MNETDPTISEGRGTVIGRYRLLQPIGEGGCGIVFLAEQEQPIRRKVALKVIKLGMDTRRVVARFEAEQQALAMMDHPNIAQVFDADATATGRPYFVMELVEGIRITDYCDQHHLSDRQRLDLFIQVCHAVQHAHQKGIIHRDLKPSNILVTELDGVPLPKIIDFGIAKAVEGRLTDQTPFSAFEQLLGTPAYMSPEQAEISPAAAGDVDTRSDIYSLGVLLYELLTGTTPFSQERLRQAGYREMRRIICEEEPEKPSTKLTKASLAPDAEGTVPQSPIANRKSKIENDLDWIVMKCLEKDRSRRYATANGLATDLKRHLNGEPVVACPPSRLYRIQKSVRRNKLAFAAAAAIATGLVLSAGVSGWQAIRASRAERAQRLLHAQAEKARAQAEAKEKEAETEAARSAQVAQLMKNMLRAVGPSVALGRDTTMLREILDQTASRLDRELAGQPEVEADLRATLGIVYSDLSLFTKAADMESRTLALRKEVHGYTHPDVASSLDSLGYVYSGQGKWTDAEGVYRQALALRVKLFGNEHPQILESLNHLAAALRGQGKYQESRSTYHQALAMGKKLLGDGDPMVMESLHGLSWTLDDEGRYAEAETTIGELLAIQKQQFTNDHPAIAVSLNMLANILLSQGKWTPAERAAREALAMNRRIFGNEYPEVPVCLNNLFLIFKGQHKLDEAEAAIREELALRRGLYGDNHVATAKSLDDLGGLLLERGKVADAEAKYREALAMRKKLFGNEHPRIAESLNSLAAALRSEKKYQKSRSTYLEALAMGKKLLGDQDPIVMDSLYGLSMTLRYERRYAEAETTIRGLLAIQKKKIPNDNPAIAISLNMLVSILCDRNKGPQAEETAREALAVRKKLFGNEHPRIVESLNSLAAALRSEKKYEESRSTYHEALAMGRKLLKDENPIFMHSLYGLSRTLRDEGKYAEAETVIRELLAIEKKKFANDNPTMAVSLDMLVSVLCDQDKWTQAEEAAREALACLQQSRGTTSPAEDVPLASGLASLTLTLLKEGKFSEAEPIARVCLAIREKKIPNDWQTFNARSMLGGSLLGQKKYQEAEPLLRSGYKGMKQRQDRTGTKGKQRLKEALERLAQLCQATGRPDQAAGWRQKMTEINLLEKR
jgi:eukaryotic-like serine/threonine-protein kinase